MDELIACKWFNLHRLENTFLGFNSYPWVYHDIRISFQLLHLQKKKINRRRFHVLSNKFSSVFIKKKVLAFSTSFSQQTLEKFDNFLNCCPGTLKQNKWIIKIYIEI